MRVKATLGRHPTVAVAGKRRAVVALNPLFGTPYPSASVHEVRSQTHGRRTCSINPCGC